MRSDEANKIVIDVETNDLSSDKNMMRICNCNDTSLAASIRNNDMNPVIALIVSYNDGKSKKTWILCCSCDVNKILI